MRFILLFAIAGCAPFTRGDLIDDDLAPRTALLVLDLQEDFVGEDAVMPVEPVQGRRAIDESVLLIDEALERDEPVVLVANSFGPKDYIGNAFRKQAAVEGTPGAELVHEVADLDLPLFLKKKPDAFSNDELDLWLRDEGVTDLVIVGVFADQCVLSTAKGGLHRGYGVAVVEDGVAAKSDDRLERAFERYDEEGIERL